MNRCQWVKNGPLEIAYHDQEWGVPLHDDQKLFELLTLEGAQAGLSWLTVLKRRSQYQEAFDGFDIAKIANYDEVKKQQLLQNAGIIRNRLKIEATIINAQKVLMIQQEWGSFDAFIWQFTNGKTIQNTWTSLVEIPTQTPTAVLMSKTLKKQGFKFVGSTICYAFMQAIGMVNDHTVDCFRHNQLNTICCDSPAIF